jgi:hypothetical protein
MNPPEFFNWTPSQNNNGTTHKPIKVKVTEETIQYKNLAPKHTVSVEIVDKSKIPTSWIFAYAPQHTISMSLVDESITSLDNFKNEYVNTNKDFYGGTFTYLPSSSSGGKRRSKKTKRSKRKTQRRR